MRHAHVKVRGQVVRVSSQFSPFFHVDLRDQTQVTEHGSKRLSPSSHLTSPTPCSFKMGLLHHGNIRRYETAQLRGPWGPHVPSDSKDTESGRELAKSQPEERGDSPVDKSICCSIMNLTQYSHKKSAMALRACKPIDVMEVGGVRLSGCWPRNRFSVSRE